METIVGHSFEDSDGVSLDVASDSFDGADMRTGSVSPNGLSPEFIQHLEALAAERVHAGGLRLMGEDGLLPELAQHLMQAALEAEMEAHLTAEAERVGGRGSRSGGNARNGYRAKKVMTEVGTVTIHVPRDRLGTFTPRVVPTHARRTGTLDQMVLSLTGKGLTSGEIVAHLAETYGMTTSKETVSTITDKALESMTEWRTRPLDSVYPVLFVDAIHVKIRDGQVANRPIYVAMAVTVDGYREILGLWCGDGGEGSKYWHGVLTELKNRGVKDVLMLVCDGLSGLPEVVNQVWTHTTVQTCIVHLIRTTLRYVSRRDWETVAKDLKPIYTAVNEDQAWERLTEFSDRWEKQYPAAVKAWLRAWPEVVPFLRFDSTIRQAICTTNAIESLNARYRRAVNACGHFPNEQAALKRLYLTTLSLDPTGKGRKRWTNRWKGAMNAFDTEFDGRLTQQH